MVKYRIRTLSRASSQPATFCGFAKKGQVSCIDVEKDFMGYKILVVDDEKDIRELLSIALMRVAGFSVESAENGEEALQKMDRERFDLVLADLKMPKMDGLQLLSEIVSSKPEILTVLMTGYGSINSALEAIRGGASDYLMKPVDMTELVVRLQKVLEDRQRFVKLRDWAAQLERVNQELKKLDEMKSEFISLASHELRTPLTAVRSAIQLMLTGKTGKINRTQKKFLSMSEVNVNRLTKIVNNLLDLSQIKSGRIEMRCEDLDLTDLIKFIIACLKPQAAGKAVELRSDIQKGFRTVYGDREMVEKIFINLIGNAIKFTPERGEVSVSARVSEEENKALISVRDTGIGIRKDQLEGLFKRFHQVEDSSRQCMDGTGLGLALTKGLVEAQEGEIWVESEFGKGSIFTFTLPISNTNRMTEISSQVSSDTTLWKS
jgi:signal transduction histidine kinase